MTIGTNSLKLIFLITVLTIWSCNERHKSNEPMQSSIFKSEFGNLGSGEIAHLFTLTNTNGMEVKITNYGGIITSISIPDKNGDFSNVVLGFDNT